MRITEVRITPAPAGGHERLLAFARITLDGEFIVDGLKVIDGRDGLFVAMPSRRLRTPYQSANGQLRAHADTAFPCTSAMRNHVEREVLAAYSLQISATFFDRKVVGA